MTSRDARVELDYAYLAAWARVGSDGTLTAVDASFVRIIHAIGVPLTFAVAARIRFRGGATAADIKIAINPPGQGTAMEFMAHLDASDAEEYADGRRHMLIALNTAFVPTTPGTAEVVVFVDEQPTRTLRFEVAAAQ